jgi:hypothetical protein
LSFFRIESIQPASQVPALDQAVSVAVVAQQPLDGAVHCGFEVRAEVHVVAVRKVLACGNDKQRSRVQGVCEDRSRAVQSLEFHPASVIVAEGVTEKLDAHRQFPGGHLVLDKQVQVGFDLLDIAKRERTQGRPESVTRPVRVEMQPTGDDPVGL